MKKYLALDAGGTKVAAILYDEDFRIIKTAVSGSLRENTTSADLIEKHISEIIEALGLSSDDRIEIISGVCEGSLIERICNLCHVGKVAMTGEFDIGLSAANIFGDGLLALSGTGASLFGKYQGRNFSTGGYGASVSDEGSGYWTARQALPRLPMMRRGDRKLYLPILFRNISDLTEINLVRQFLPYTDKKIFRQLPVWQDARRL